MERASSKRLSLARLLVVLCAVALCAGDLFRGLHLLTTRHVVCAEHGELVHADDLPPAPASHAADRAAASPSGETAHHHDHCDLAATRPGQGAAILPGTALAVPAAAADVAILA